MTEIKKELNNIFEKNRQKYKTIYDNSGTLQSHADNGNNFSPIFKKLTDELIEKANEYLEKNESKSKTELEEYIKELIKKFSPLMLNPN